MGGLFIVVFEGIPVDAATREGEGSGVGVVGPARAGVLRNDSGHGEEEGEEGGKDVADGCGFHGSKYYL